MRGTIRLLSLVLLALLVLSGSAAAQRRGGGGGFRGGGGGFRGGGFSSRGVSRASVSRRPAAVTRPSQLPATRRPAVATRPGRLPANRPAGGYRGNTVINRPVNVRNVNIGDGRVDPDWDVAHDGCCYLRHPVAAGAVVGAAAAATYGSAVYTLPSSCVTVVEDGTTYYHCGNVWYEPQFIGTNTSYVVVASPQ